jgi:hypothetical protein
VSEESKAAMQAQQSSPGAVRPEIVSILKQTKPGGCLAGVGVRGRLGDLGAIDNEYDTAISTACGCLDFIVVDSNSAASACIDYLKYVTHFTALRFFPSPPSSLLVGQRTVAEPPLLCWISWVILQQKWMPRFVFLKAHNGSSI